METRNIKNQPIKNIGLCRLPPQAIDLEIVILGALILMPVAAGVWARIKSEFFYKDNHQKIFTALYQLYEERSAIDIKILISKLRKNGELEMIGGAYYLTELTQNVSSSANIDFHIAVIHEKYLSRELIRLAHEMMTSSYEDSSNPLHDIGLIITQVNKLKNGIFKRTERKASELVSELREERKKPKSNIIGLSTGKKGLDYITEGHQPNQLIIKAGRPGSGKSSDMCSEIVSCCFDEKYELKPKEEQIPVACFSLEMNSTALVNWMLSGISSIDSTRIKKNNLSMYEDTRLAEYEDKISQAEIYIDDTPALTIDEFEAKAAMLVALYGVKKIYIDFLQIMLGSPNKKYGNREAEVSDISRRLKLTAKELNITIIALCQLSRAVESRKLCLPILSDLRESGSIEQDADEVHFIWRPEYYPEVLAELEKPGGGIDIALFNLKIEDFKGVMICIVAKCREEQTGKVPLRFKGALKRVSDHPLVLDALKAIEHTRQYGGTELQPNPKEDKF